MIFIDAIDLRHRIDFRYGIDLRLDADFRHGIGLRLQYSTNKSNINIQEMLNHPTQLFTEIKLLFWINVIV